MTNANGNLQGLSGAQFKTPKAQFGKVNMSKLLYYIAIHRSRRYYVWQYSLDFWSRFKAGSDARLAEILPKVPDIGVSLFSFNYLFAPYYIAWYKTLLELGNTPKEAD